VSANAAVRAALDGEDTGGRRVADLAARVLLPALTIVAPV